MDSVITFRGLVGTLAIRKPFIFVTWLSAAVFGALYVLEDQIILFGSGTANFAGVNLPTQILLFGPKPMQGPPQVAYYLTVLGDFGMFQINLSGLVVASLLATLFGINISLILFLRRRVRGTRRSFGSLLAILPSLLSTSGCCCCAPLYLLLLGDVAADSVGFALLPYFSAFVYASFALIVLNIYYFGRKAIAVSISEGCKLRGYQ